MALDAAAARLFGTGRSHGRWLARPVPQELLEQAWALAAMGPTSMNCQPLRVCFVRSAAARARLLPCLDAGNVPKTAEAPVTAVFGHDLAFPDRLSVLFPHKPDAAAYHRADGQKLATTALRNGSLQAAYFMLAARLLGLDCGPMSGFDAAAVDAAFWTGTPVRTNFLCNLGFGDAAALKPRLPRLGWSEACRTE